MFVASMNWPLQAAWKNGDMQRTSSCAAKSRCSRPTTRVIIEDVNVLQLIVSDRRLLKNDKISDAYLPSGFASASVGTLRIDRSWRFFDTACSLNDDFPFDRRLFEKLSLLNILGRWVGRLSKWRTRRSTKSFEDVDASCCRNCRNLCRFGR